MPSIMFSYMFVSDLTIFFSIITVLLQIVELLLEKISNVIYHGKSYSDFGKSYIIVILFPLMSITCLGSTHKSSVCEHVCK